MLKIFLTGDNHLGLKYASHEEATIISAKRFEAFENMVRVANLENCSIFAVAGDLFENTYGISKKEIKGLLDVLSGFNGTVVVLPGNHDFYDEGVKIWQYFEDVMPLYDNIMLLKNYRPYEIAVDGEEVVLYPALCKSLHSVEGENNIGWIKDQNISDDGKYHIGIAHGAIDGETIDSEGRYFLMKRDELESIPVDVWLIGHTHVSIPKNLTENFEFCGDKIFNAGTHVQTDVSCNTEGQCIIIEIGADKKLRAKKFVSGNLRFFRLHVELSADEMENIISRALEDVPNDSVVDLVLSGAVSAEEYNMRKELVESVLSRFVEGSYNDYAVSKVISKELIDSEFPETSFSVGLLTALLDDPKEAQLAYELLKGLKEGK